MTWGWVINERILILGWTIPLGLGRLEDKQTIIFDAGEMDRNKDLRGFDKGQIVEGEGRVSLNRQGLWVAPGQQWWEFTNSSPRRDKPTNWWEGVGT